MTRLAIIGTRGIPAHHGGFETFAQELSTRLRSDEIEVVVYCERSEEQRTDYEGIKLRYSRYLKSQNPLLYYGDCIRKAVGNADVLLVAGTAGAFFYWIPMMRRTALITNVDGIESRRGKWGWVIRSAVKLTEFIAVVASDMIIADSKAIKKYLHATYHLIPEDRVSVIEYGAVPNRGPVDTSVLSKYGLTDREYYIVVARLEPENNILEIAEGFRAAATNRILLIVGGLQSTSYVKRLMTVAAGPGNRIILVGAIYDRMELDALRYYCYAYIHGHSVGGTNPSLLEGLAAANITICHDNEFNREVTEDMMYYFSSSSDLAMRIEELEQLPDEVQDEKKRYASSRIASYYNWDRITDAYRLLIRNCVKN